VRYSIHAGVISDVRSFSLRFDFKDKRNKMSSGMQIVIIVTAINVGDMIVVVPLVLLALLLFEKSNLGFPAVFRKKSST